MNNLLKNLIGKMLIGCLVLCFMTGFSFARFLVNWSGEGGYTGAGEDSGNPIETYVVEGAGFYLKGYSDVQEFLSLFELLDTNGVNYSDWLKVVDSAQVNMKNAADTYLLLVAEAEATPYNEEFIASLKEFDYTGFMNEKGLNSVIFQDCAGYLKAGDITGMYHSIYDRLTSIQGILNTIKADLDANKVPALVNAYELNEICAGLSLFGQYASMVFYEISKK